MQIEKARINYQLLASKVSWGFCITTLYNFAVIYPWNLLFSLKVGYFLTVSIVFLFTNKLYGSITWKLEQLWMYTFQCFFICTEVIIYLLLHNLHDCTFNGKLHFLSREYSTRTERIRDVLKGYLRHKTITSQNMSSEAQIKDFFIP